LVYSAYSETRILRSTEGVLYTGKLPACHDFRWFSPLFFLSPKRLSRTQINTQDVTQLCHEIRDIKKGPINNKLPDDLSKISSNIPGQWDIHDKRVLSYAENAYNKLCPVPPSDNHDSLARRDSSPPPGPPPPAQTPPGPPPFRTPSPASETSAETPYVTVVPGSGESPTDAENRARNSPCES